MADLQKSSLKYKDRGPDVQKLRADLEALGYAVTDSKQASYFSRETETRVKELQREHGLAATGVVDSESRSLLDELLRRSSADSYVVRGPSGGERIITMNKEQLLALQELSRQTPNELRNRRPELYAQVRAQADEQL